MHLFLLPFLLTLFSSTLAQNQEAIYLHRVKLSLYDPDNTLSTWNTENSTTPCNWYGIKCNPLTRSVNSVDLSSSNLAGPFPLILCNLQDLTSISFYNNSINSTLPEGIATCTSLHYLNLAQNLLSGMLPKSLSELQNLKVLDLTGNNFSGKIPVSFGKFRHLEILSLVENLFDGEVPGFLGNISSLKQLNLSYNPFLPGRIPPEFGGLVNLEVLWLSDCNFVGEIPDSLSRLSKLVDFDLAANRLRGVVPGWLTGLTSLIQIELYNNSLSGELPNEGWGEMKGLRLLDVSMNQLSGRIPEGLCSLPLESINLYENRFEGELPESIVNSTNLYELRLFGNRLSGELPKNLGKNSPLKLIDVSSNRFSGELPPSLCEKGVLEELLLINNSFSGGIPESLGKCRSLTRVRLGYNNLSGVVPDEFWGLPNMFFFELVGNSFSGQIAKTVAGASALSSLNIYKNNFSGNIPEEIGFLENLKDFSGSDNRFSGVLPVSIVKLEQLGRLDLHNNELSGIVPEEIGSLSGLNYLDISGNRFSGNIPIGLQNLKLNQLNLSSNQFSGHIPELYAKQIYWNSFLGNPGLCKEIDSLCDRRGGARSMGYVWMLRTIFLLSGVVLIVGLVLFFRKYNNVNVAKRANDKSKWTLMSFHKLGFSESEILGALDEDNVIGSGASGKVYRVVLRNGEAVAVKKLWGGSKMVDEDGDVEKGSGRNDGFEAEVETLGKIRHKNIVRLWCCCTTRDCKLLVYEYMPNGSLGDLLHSSKSGLLDWPTRYKIAMDAAEGLSYLHHDCVPPIVHRDVKSNNILLNEDFGARVADFGLAKAVDAIGKGNNSMSVIAGSCGYIAPEYAYTLRVNEKSDTYSFGVVILELVTGRLPVDPEFGEKDLVKWVCTTLDQKGIDHVIDPKLDSCFKEEICKVLNVGLICTSPLPINRPSIRRVVKMLHEIGGCDNQLKIVKKDGKLSPYYYEDASDQGSVA
ncbi:receptor-like protein kinase HSL1 [Heracleum sosnowskyi]|uniref:non-specific serine/threonine protein kinase n=1 Tax=Heracleum sosnowskyi TaxID=360622 RepID=A0AAD8MDI9_9APIA|nr:receptor-like protein kinase HSL1 [Heracleum sosnowskyi]